MAAQVMMKALGFLFNVYVVRRLGDEHFGRYAAVMAFVSIFAIFSDLGMAPYMLREIAADRKNVRWLLPNVVALRLLLSIGVVAASTLVANLLGKGPEMVLGIFIGACSLFMYAFQGPLDSTLVAWERLDYSATFSFASQLVFWGLGTAFLIIGWGFVGLLVASLVSVASLALLEGRIVLREVGWNELTLVPHRWGELIKASLPFGISGLSFSLQSQFDTAYMSIMLTDAAVGWYNVPLQLVQMSMLLAQSVCSSMFPSLARAYSEDRISIYGIVQRTLKYLLMLSLPIAVGGAILADRLIPFLYTEEFVNSIVLMRILIWTVPILFLSELLGVVNLATHRERTVAKINVFNAFISVVLNLIAVPVAGAVGAALARVGSRGIRLGQYWRLLGSRLLVGEHWKDLLRVALAAGVMGAGLILLRNLNLFISIGAGASLYVLFLFLFRAVDREEVRRLLDLLARRRIHQPAVREPSPTTEV